MLNNIDIQYWETWLNDDKYRMKEKIILVNDLKQGDNILKYLNKSNYSYINLNTKTIEDIARESIKYIIIRENKQIISDVRCIDLIKRTLNTLQEDNKLHYFKDIVIDDEISKYFYKTITELKLENIDLKSIDDFSTNEKLKDIQLILEEYNNELIAKDYLDKGELHILALKEGDLCNGVDKYCISLYDDTISKVEYEIIQKYATELMVVSNTEAKITENQEDKLKKIPKKNIDGLLKSIKAKFNPDEKNIELFSGYGESNELYEILRKIKEIKNTEDIKFEDIAIYHTSNEKYVQRMYELSKLMDIPVSFEDGISISNKREAKLIYKLVEWVKSDYRDDILYELVDYLYLDEGISKVEIKNMLSKFNIGLGKERYKERIPAKIIELKEKYKNKEKTENLLIIDNLIKDIPTQEKSYEELINGLEYILKIFELEKEDNKKVFELFKNIEKSPDIETVLDINKALLKSEINITDNTKELVHKLVKWIGSNYNNDRLYDLKECFYSKQELNDDEGNLNDDRQDKEFDKDKSIKIIEEKLSKIINLYKYERELYKISKFKSVVDTLIDNIPNEETTYAEAIKGIKEILKKFKPKQNNNKDILEILEQLKCIEEKLDVNKILQRIEKEIRRTTIKEKTGDDKDGRIYFSHYKNGYYNDRKYHFIVGLDSNKFPKKISENPILLDDERKKINSKSNQHNLNLAENIPNKEKLQILDLINTRQGKVFISYCGFDFKENKNNTPSHLFLELARIVYKNPSLSYEQLNKELGNMKGFAASELNKCLSKKEQWLSYYLKEEKASMENEIYRKMSISRKSLGEIDDYKDLYYAFNSKENKDALTEYDGKVKEDKLLKFINDEEKSMSVTQMKDFITCPYKYFLKRVLKIYNHKPRTLEYKTWLKSNEFGSLVHRVFEEFYKNLKDNNETLEEKKHIEEIKKLAKTLRENFEDKEYAFLDQRIYDETIKRIDLICEKFINDELQRRKDNNRLNVEHTEYEFGNDEKKVAINLGENREKSLLYINGKIDRIDKINDNEYEIIDYKTGKGDDHKIKKPKEDEIPDDLNKGKNIQNIIYAMACKELLENNKVEKTQYYLINKDYENRKPLELNANEENIKNCKEILNEMIYLIENGYFVKCYSKNKQNGPCSYCDYKTICELESYKKTKIEKLLDENQDEKIKGRLAFYE